MALDRKHHTLLYILGFVIGYIAFNAWLKWKTGECVCDRFHERYG